MDIEVPQIPAVGSSKKSLKMKRKRKRKQLAKKEAMAKNGPQINDNSDGNLEVSNGLRDCMLVNNDLEKNISNTDIAGQTLAECPKMAAELTMTLPEVNGDEEMKKRQKRTKKKAKSMVVVQSIDQTKMDTESSKNLAEVNVKAKRKRNKRKTENKDETRSMEQTDEMLNLHLSNGDHGSGIDGRITEFMAQESEVSLEKESSVPGLVKDNKNPSDICTKEEDILLPEVNVNVQRKRNKRKTKKTKDKDEIRSMEQTDEMLNLNLSDGDHGSGGINGRITEFMTQVSEVSLEKESSVPGLVKYNENSSDLCTKEEDALLPDVAKVSCSSEFVKERPGDFLRPMEVEEKLITFEGQRSSDPIQMDVQSPKFRNVLDEVNSEIVVDEGTSMLVTCDVERTAHVSSPDVKEAECLEKVFPRIAPISSSKRKLIVLDVNGLLANIFFPAPKDYRGDTHILGRAVFKRPFCDDFLKFCFQNFDVGIWSSRSKKLIDRVVEYLLGDLQSKLIFCWDMDHSTQTGYKTLENNHKPLVCKELRKIWESDYPNLTWEKGYYNESNTLLLDDSPYKALLNPLHTAIFPHSYHHEDKSDNSLGPGGDLRVYLEGLLLSDNVQKYVEQNPFGQSAINENSSSWGFYSGVLQAMLIKSEDTTHSSLTISS